MTTTTRCSPPSRPWCAPPARSSGPLVGAASVWAAGPDEVADLLGMPPANVRETATALRRRLVAAHDAARAAEGLSPADWTLDVDLDAVVESLLAGQGDPPDPAALVDERRRSVRRRSLVVGGAAALAAGAAAWWVVPHGPDASASGASASPSPARGPARGRPQLGEAEPLGRTGPARHRPAGAGPRHQPLWRRLAPALRRRRRGPAGRRGGDPQRRHRGPHRAGLARRAGGRPGHAGRGALPERLRRRHPGRHGASPCPPAREPSCSCWPVPRCPLRTTRRS